MRIGLIHEKARGRGSSPLSDVSPPSDLPRAAYPGGAAVTPMAKPKTQKQTDADFVRAVNDIRRFYLDDQTDHAIGTSEAFASLSERDRSMHGLWQRL